MSFIAPISYRLESFHGVGPVAQEEAERVAAALGFAVVIVLASFADSHYTPRSELAINSKILTDSETYNKQLTLDKMTMLKHLFCYSDGITIPCKSTRL